MIKIRIHYLLVVAVTTAIISSCQSNEIHLDFDKQLICSSNSTGLRRIHIDKANSVESYMVLWEDSTGKAPLQLSLFPLTKGYTVRGGWKDTVVDLQYFKLDANKVYLIKRAGGDAGECTIKVLTDGQGRFLKITQ